MTKNLNNITEAEQDALFDSLLDRKEACPVVNGVSLKPSVCLKHADNALYTADRDKYIDMLTKTHQLTSQREKKARQILTKWVHSFVGTHLAVNLTERQKTTIVEGAVNHWKDQDITITYYTSQREPTVETNIDINTILHTLAEQAATAR